MDSKAAFKARALEVGLSEDLLQLLDTKNVATFGQFAFISPSNPNSTDDKIFKEAIESVIDREALPTEMVTFRRLWYESHAIAMSDLRSRLDKSPADPPKQVPLAERMLRLKRQRDEFKGLVFDAHIEPAHGLIDKIQAMLDDNSLTYIAPEKCMSREQEISKDKAEPLLAFNSDGNIKLSRKSIELSCNISGETNLRAAFTRRALGFDQTGILSFVVMEKWHNSLFRALQKVPPNGYKYVTIQQIIAADKELFTIVAQESRGELKLVPGSAPPLDKFFQEHSTSQEVLCYLNPLPASQGSNPNVVHTNPPDTTHDTKKGEKGEKGNGKGNGKSKGPTVGELLKSMPQGCVSKMPDGKFLRLRYQHGTCYYQRKKRCNNGLHKCYYKGCHKDRPYNECSH